MKIFHLILNEIVLRWRTTLTMGAILAIPILFYLILSGYQNGLERRYLYEGGDYLVIQNSGSMGEFHGSRLTADLKNQLREMGYPDVVMQINTVTGTSPDTAILLRGIQLDRYQEYELFKMIEGRPLQPEDPPRSAMIGIRLAQQRNATAGDLIEIRGRNFRVTGVFEVGTYADYEAWIALADAQTLLGWGGDVSVFIVPVDGPLKAGDVLSEGISVVRRGESGMDLVQEWAPFFRLLHQINLSLGAAIAISLMHNMWRISWQRRRDLAILTSMGFNRSEIYLYLISYGIGIAIVGIALAGLASIVVFNLIQLRTAGITTEAIHEPEEILIGLVVVLISTLLAAGIPARNLLKRNVIELMKIES